MVMQLVRSDDTLFKKFLDYVMVPQQLEQSIAVQKQRTDMLRHLVSLFFVNISDDDWINGRKI